MCCKFKINGKITAINWVLLTSLIGISLLIGCKEGKDLKTYRIGFSQCCDDNWRTAMNLEMKREVAFHPELELLIEVAGSNSQKQIEDIDLLVKSGIDLLIVSPNESAPLIPKLDSVYKNGMPIIMVDRKTDSKFYSAFVGGDNFEIGRSAAKYLKDAHPEGIRAMELELGRTMTPAIERNLGFHAELKDFKNHKVLASYQDNEGVEILKEKVEMALKNHPDINCVFAHTDLLAQSASNWINEFAPNQNITIVGVDALPGEGNGIDMVEKKVINASILYPTCGSEAILLAKSILYKLPFDKENKLNTSIINLSNARTVQLQFKKMNGLQSTIDQQLLFLDSFKKIFKTQRIFIGLLITSLIVSFILGFYLWKLLKNKQLANNELVLKNEEIINSQIHILEMSEELKLATNAKVNFFTNISHELRTPLTLIMGLTDELIRQRVISKQNSTGLKQIKQNSIRLIRLINQLMDFRKADSNMMKLKVSEYNINEFINAIAQSFKSIADQRNIDFEIIAKKTELKLWFDPDKLDKVIFNIISNAFKFTPDGGYIRIILLTDNFENTFKINIEDSGSGIPEEDYQKIFEPFYQTKMSNFSGTGLGLYLSKFMIEMHGGSITVQSFKNKGTRFSISLPIGKSHFTEDQIFHNLDYNLSYDSLYDDSLQYQLGQTEDREIKPSTTYHLLIIEDNPEIQDFLKRNFEHVYQVSQSLNGELGLSDATELVPDVIICDLALPGIEGLQIIKQLKTDLRTSHIPIIILTSKATINQQIECTNAGADAFITKPFNIQLLEATIQNLIHNRLILKETLNKDFVAFQKDHGLTKLDQDFMNKVLVYINDHFSDPLFQVNDICKEVNLSRSQLYRKIKSLMGENISDYILNKRLANAENLLAQSEKTVAEVAYLSGFSSPDYFSTVFRQKYNITPSQFRKTNTETKQL